MDTPAEPTYRDLVAERAREWADAQRRAAAEVEATRARLLAMPDLVPPLSPWETKDVTCRCGGRVFEVRRWSSCNGAKHRAELECVACRTVGTWDFGEKKWIG